MPEVVDILNIKPDERVGAVSEAPRSKLSQSQLEQPGRDMQRAFEQVARGAAEGGAALERGAVTAAERQAYGDLAKQKITRDDQGNIQVLNPANSFFWGEAGRRYEEMVRQGTSAQMVGQLNLGMVEAAGRNPFDPAKFKANSDAQLDTFAGSPAGQSPAGAEALMRGRERQVQHLDYITNRAATLDWENNRTAVLDEAKSLKQDLLGLAGEPGSEKSPEFQKKSNRLDEIWNSLPDDPRFKTPKEAVDLERKQFQTQIVGERMVSVLPKLVDEQGMNAAKKALDDFEKRGDLEPSVRRQIAAQGRATLAEATPKWNEENRAFDTKLEGIKKGLQSHTLSPDDPNIQQLVRQEKERGYNRGPELEALIADAPLYKHMGTLTPEQRNDAVGIPNKANLPAGTPTDVGTGAPGSAPADIFMRKAPDQRSDAVGLPKSPADPYAKIPPIGEHGENQIARFRQWNPDPIGNSEANLATVHPDLQAVVRKAQADNPDIPFIVALGKSTPEQEKLAQSWGWGQAGTGGSHHLEGNTVDLWPLDKEGHVVFDKDRQRQISQAMQKAAGELGQQVRWGGLTGEGGQNKSFRDAPNFELLNPRERAQPAAFTPGPMPTGGPNAGQYQPVIDAAAKKYGIDPSLLTRQLFRENRFQPTGTSSAGAQGIAQFIPSTADRYGVNVNDPNSSIEGAAHYMSDLVKRYNGNVGLALAGYNWGENNVDRWIGRAGSTTSQGGGYGGVPRETQQYVQAITGHSLEEWRKDPNLKVTGGSMGGGGGVATPRWTDAQLKANPWLGASIFEKGSADHEQHLSFYNATIDNSTKTMKFGGLPDPQQWADIESMHAEHAGDPRWEEKYNDAKGFLDATLAEMGGPQAQAAWKAQQGVIAAGGGGADPYARTRAAEALEHFDQLDKNWAEKPMRMAQNTGMVPQLPPLNVSDPQQAIGALQQRGQVADAIAARRGTPVSALEGDDLNLARQAFQFGTPQQKLTLLEGMRNYSPGTLNATLGKIGKMEGQGGFAIAGGLMAANHPEAAQAILQGKELLGKDPEMAPRGTKLDSLMQDALPPGDFRNSDARAAVADAARAVYATLTASGQGKSGDSDTEKFKTALDTVTGGVVEYRGAKVLAPAYGAKADDLDRALGAVTDDRLSDARAPDGSPVTAAQIRGSTRVGLFWGQPVWQLESVGGAAGGLYAVRSGDSYLMDSKTGQPFVLNLANAPSAPLGRPQRPTPDTGLWRGQPSMFNLPGATPPSPAGTVTKRAEEGTDWRNLPVQ